MSQLNLKVIGELEEDLFSRMDPSQQAAYVNENSDQPEAVKEMYPRAKDKMVRFLIVQSTRDQQLADRLFKTLTADDQLLRFKLLPYVSAAVQNAAKQAAMQFFNDFEAAVNTINHLNPYESRALLQSVKALGLPLNQSLMEYLERSVKKEPLVDTEEL